jgi:hypothetical protein
MTGTNVITLHLKYTLYSPRVAGVAGSPGNIYILIFARYPSQTFLRQNQVVKTPESEKWLQPISRQNHSSTGPRPRKFCQSTQWMGVSGGRGGEGARNLGFISLSLASLSRLSLSRNQTPTLSLDCDWGSPIRPAPRRFGCWGGGGFGLEDRQGLGW